MWRTSFSFSAQVFRSRIRCACVCSFMRVHTCLQSSLSEQLVFHRVCVQADAMHSMYSQSNKYSFKTAIFHFFKWISHSHNLFKWVRILSSAGEQVCFCSYIVRCNISCLFDFWCECRRRRMRCEQLEITVSWIIPAGMVVIGMVSLCRCRANGWSFDSRLVALSVYDTNSFDFGAFFPKH